jgi:uncharacterized membrane protein YqgA involved in biofilm formation
MIGVAINAIGIVAGGIVGLTRKKPLTAANESFFKVAMGAAAVFLGLQLTWQNLTKGSVGLFFKQLLIVLISMSIGKLLGKLLHLQKFSNSIGRYATTKMSGANPAHKNFNDGLVVCALLSCANPLAIFASIQEGLTGFAPIFVVKAVMDGLAALAFVSVFGWGVAFSSVPVIAFQGTIFLLVKYFEPTLKAHGLVDSILATNGLLIFCVALIILNLKKIELTDYIPSLVIAPLITWLWK